MSTAARNFFFGAVLVAATLLAYAPALRAGFVWNDRDYVTAPELRSLDGLRQIWFHVGATEQYYPLLHGAFWVQHRLWGDHPAGYHLLNVLLHAGAALLFAAVLRRLAVPGAWLAAFVFALHPVCVESVAWISEQKNTQSLVFFLAAALGYLRFDANRRAAAYAGATALFICALLSKTTVAVLPPALLVVFWWRRGRLDPRRDVAPLLPWFALGAAAGLFSAWVEKTHLGADGAEFALGPAQRLLLAGRIPWFYLGQLLWPADLVFIYPRWTVDAGAVAAWLWPLATLAALAVLWRLRHRSRAPLAAVLFFGGTLFPVLGFFNVFAFLYSFVADHWQYLPALGLIALAAAALTRLLAAGPASLRIGLPALLVVALAAQSASQARAYSDLKTLYHTTVIRNPAAWMAHNNLGNLYRDAGRLDLAVAHLEAALHVRPDLPKAHLNLGHCLRDLKRPADALAHYRQAAALDPAYAEAHNQLGRTLREAGRPAEALASAETAVRLAPALPDARNNLGMILRDLRRLAEALLQFETAVRLDPASAPAHLNLALTLAQLGRGEEALAAYAAARRLNPAIPPLPARP